MATNKKKEYNNLGSFFRDLPEECPKLAPLLLYVNRSSIASFFKINGKISFMIPSEEMMAELKRDFEKKDFKNLDLKILALLIPESITSISDWRNVSLSSGKTVVPIKSINSQSVVFENGSKAMVSNKFKSGNISFWELNGNNIPLGSIYRGKKSDLKKTKTTTKKGKFENHESTIDSAEKIEILEDFKKGRFKELVCDLYNACDTDNQKIADCLINNNPVAEFFYLFDSPMITYSSSTYVDSKITNADKFYEGILAKKNEYLCNSGDTELIEKLRKKLGNSHFYENEYKDFYKQVEETGNYNLDGEIIKICPPIMGKYLYSIELFGLYVRVLTENMTDENRDEIMDKIILFNAATNTKSTENLIFDDDGDLSINLNDFKARFKKCGLSFCKKSIPESSGALEKAKPRKLVKIKKAFSGMTNEQKQKLIKYLNKSDI